MAQIRDTYEVREAAYSVLAAPTTNAGGFQVLGRLIGPHFVPDGTSRNQRFYPKSLWEKVIKNPSTQAKLERKLMFGTIGHADNFDVEKFAREGLLSHMTVKVWIDEDTGLGMCEDWILDTPAGRNLLAFCKAGCRFYTSSRAAGSFKNEKYNGMPVVDEDTYDLGGWDMVVDPGFLQADPSLVESLKKNGIKFDVQTITEKSGGNDMSAELLEKLTREKLAIEKGLNEALTELNTYKKIGPASRIIEALKYLKGYKDLGSPVEITKAFDMAEATINDYKSLGSPAEIKKALAVAEKMMADYKELGTPAEIGEALDRATELFEQYKPLGTPAEIDEALDKALRMADNQKAARNEAAAKRLAKAYSVPFKVVKTMIEGMGDLRKVESVLKGLSEEGETSYGIPDDAPGLDADGTLTKHFDDEGETILGDVVGPEGGAAGALGGGAGGEGGGEGEFEFGGEPEGEPEGEPKKDEEDDGQQEFFRRRNRNRAVRMTESAQKKTGYKPASIFEQLISKR